MTVREPPARCDTIEVLLSQRKHLILEDAVDELQRARLEHYLADGEALAHERMARLLELVLVALRTQSVDCMVDYVTAIAHDRFARQYRLSEVQTSFNVLQEALWNQVLAVVEPQSVAHSLGLVLAVLDIAKDTLARVYVELTSEHWRSQKKTTASHTNSLEIIMPHSPSTPTQPLTGMALLQTPLLNRGSAFTDSERDRLGLRGLLPPRVQSQDQQVRRVMENIDRVDDPLQQYLKLTALQDRNEGLFFRVLVDHLEQLMPLIYTPTVGKACQEYGHIFRRPRGLYVTAEDHGRVASILRNWPHFDVQCIVVTDGERILGLGDLGASGMCIPVGKLALYTACAGIHPARCLPVVIDVGTENEQLLDCPLYLGLPQRRQRGQQYDDLIDEFFEAAHEVFPGALIQLEDFANRNAFRLLERYRERYLTFNDDIQGTGAVALAGLMSAARITQRPFSDTRVLFFGAGEAAIGTADLVVTALCKHGMSADEAKRRCWLFDSRGLVVAGRDHLNEGKRRYAHDGAPAETLLGAVEQLEPSALIGVSGIPGAFDHAVVAKMSEINDRPIIFALSNPTEKAECTAAFAYRESAGRAVFASGSPFAPVTLDGRTYEPGQGNNAYIFPGVGLGVIGSGARTVTDEMFAVAANTLAELVSDEDLQKGRIYPDLTRIREVSARIAADVAELAYSAELTVGPRPEGDMLALMRGLMYDPHY
jgi:malate dehydrogenase (oxaloacetate-decarboxylating)(NADP+)